MLKTYSHLLAARRMPTDYELTSNDLMYQARLPPAVSTPALAFQRRHPLSLRCSNWDGFRDPRATTYTSYVSQQRDREVYLDHLLASIDGTDYDAQLDPQWLGLLSRLFATLRYPCHGLHMLAAYVAHAAPSSRIAIAAAFQTADELRRVQRIAYRTRQLMLVNEEFGAQARTLWECEPAFQPLRATIERLLVSYEWGQAFVALNLVLKPLFDELVCHQLAELARERRDDVLARLLWSLRDDQRWHRSWSRALLAHLRADAPAGAENLARMRGFVQHWLPEARMAVRALCEPIGALEPGAPSRLARLERAHSASLEDCGLIAPQTDAQGDGARPDEEAS